MSRAPLVMPKAHAAFSRNAEIYDTTIGWRFVNPLMEKNVRQGVHAGDSGKRRGDNTTSTVLRRIALRSARSRKRPRRRRREFSPRRLRRCMCPGQREHARPSPRTSTCVQTPRSEALAKLPTPFRENGTVTAGNASGINDGACAMFVASEEAAARFGLTPIARVLGAATAGVEPDVMGIGPIPAMQKLLARLKLSMDDVSVLELNEAFAAQALAVTRAFGLPDDCERVNPNGGAIALGHPLGMSGARLVLTAARELRRRTGRYAIASMCIGVGQGIALALERV